MGRFTDPCSKDKGVKIAMAKLDVTRGVLAEARENLNTLTGIAAYKQGDVYVVSQETREQIAKAIAANVDVIIKTTARLP